MLKDLSHLLVNPAKGTAGSVYAVMSRSGIQTNLGFGCVHHTCLCCLREHQTHDQAKQCVGRCFAKLGISVPIIRNAAKNGLVIAKTLQDLEANREQKVTLSLVNNSQNVRLLQPEKRGVGADAAKAASTEVINLMTEIRKNSGMTNDFIPPPPVSLPALLAPQATQIQFGNESKAFLRADAAYKCKGCGKKYFTRSEVESCFEAHE